MIFAIMLKKSLLFYLLITSLPDTTGGEGNPPVRRHHALFPEDTHRCFAAGYDVVYTRASAYLSSQKKGAPKDTFLTIFLNEDFEGEYDDKITLLDSFLLLNPR